MLVAFIGIALPMQRPVADDGIPDGFEAVTQDGETVTQDGAPVYVAEE